MEAIDRTYHFKKTLEKKERFVGGHRLCAGCGAGIAVRGVLRALREEDRAVVGNATGCLEVSSFLYPYTAYEDSYIHTAFESAGATLSGVEAAYNALKRKGQVKGEVKFITFGGDGEPMTSGSSPSPGPWSGATTSPTSATTTRPI